MVPCEMSDYPLFSSHINLLQHFYICITLDVKEPQKCLISYAKRSFSGLQGKSAKNTLSVSKAQREEKYPEKLTL